MKVKIDIKRTKIKKEIFFSVCAAASIKFRNKKKYLMKKKKKS